jgi:DNA-binding NtrC family response regulator
MPTVPTMAHVLLVDDFRPIRSAMTRYLRLYGHRVTEAANVHSALERVEEGIDVVVTALTMPRRSGAELLQALRDRQVTTPVIMMSGRFPAPEETIGAAFVLQRPFDPLELLYAVDEVLSARPAKDIAGT